MQCLLSFNALAFLGMRRNFAPQKKMWHNASNLTRIPKINRTHHLVANKANAAYSTVNFPSETRKPLMDSSASRDNKMWANLVHLSRITKPTGIWLLYLPCAWSTQFGSYSMLSTTPTLVFCNPKLLVMFLFGSVFMRTAGCVLNDIYDRKIDSLVERTSGRPLAAGTLSIATAYKFMGVLCVGGLGILSQLPPLAAAISFAAVLPCIIYPLMKRITYYPQLMLGVAFNWGALVGYPAVLLPLACVADPLSISALYPMLPTMLPLYFGGILWTLVYDTIYAYQDLKDDVKIGVKSTAIKFGPNPTKVLSLFSALAIFSFNIAGWINGQSLVYFGLLNGGLLPFLLWQVNWANYSSPASCWKMFSLSSYFGLAFFCIILIDSYLLGRRKEAAERGS